MDEIPTGSAIFKHFIGILVCLELVCGALVWILVASTNVSVTAISQGYIMFVSVSFFVITFLWLCVYLFTSPRESNTSITFEAFLITAAFVLYLSASVLQANVTICAVHNCDFSTDNNNSTESVIITNSSSSSSTIQPLSTITAPTNFHHTSLEAHATPPVKTTDLSAPSRTTNDMELDEAALNGRLISKTPSSLSRIIRSIKILKEGGISSNPCLMRRNDYRINIAATVRSFAI
uniref:MARVEL domain-containing protein n=1 Tax=Eptatretus burgeri TaxID=7764 RepID=A0A8C4NPG1_EPTBU